MTGWTEDGIARAWRALARQEGAEDWRFVHLTDMGAVSVEAGCHLPLGREALIVSFPGSWPVNPARLPEGKGFDVIVNLTVAVEQVVIFLAAGFAVPCNKNLHIKCH